LKAIKEEMTETGAIQMPWINPLYEVISNFKKI